MKKSLLIIPFTLLTGILFAQNYILTPNTESSLISLNPGFVGENYKNRLAVNYLYQSHPLGDIQTIQVSNDFDIPKINLRTGIVVSADRIATKNQSILKKKQFCSVLRQVWTTSSIFFTIFKTLIVHVV